MNLISVFSCLALLLATAATQVAKPCVAPPLMTGHVSVMANNGHVMSSGAISYDAYGQKIRVRAYGLVGNETFVLDQLMLFNQEVYYEIDWYTQSCKKMPLDTSFIPMQVPPNAKLMGQAVLGSSSSWGMGVLVNTWFGPLSHHGHYSTVFTEIGCIPLTINGFTPQSGWTTVSTYDWVLGLSNPMDFFPPSFCHASVVERETPRHFFSIMESLAMKTKSAE